MAEHGAVEYATAAGNDYAEHERTYEGVMRLTKVGTVAVIAVVVSLAIFTTVGSVFWTFVGVVGAGVVFTLGMARDTATPAAVWLVFLLLVWALMV